MPKHLHPVTFFDRREADDPAMKDFRARPGAAASPPVALALFDEDGTPTAIEEEVPEAPEEEPEEELPLAAKAEESDENPPVRRRRKDQ